MKQPSEPAGDDAMITVKLTLLRDGTIRQERSGSNEVPPEVRQTLLLGMLQRVAHVYCESAPAEARETEAERG